ncbi:MAG: Asp-tRNA(Asn)/Glu-tRNA(Gln) amidotransferase subunit GatB [Candidatus Pacebacteria bacterium]|nr:Asp-tRNA(Asn)/Glu-tRNA(Gln) amidotransferase subunit GatB [Candidatus Paceibacterota bacterium]
MTGALHGYEAIIGLEVHIQVRTSTKLFCGCPNRFGGEPNTRVCPVCMGYPGVLPVLNREAVRKTLGAGLMCDCTINTYSKFDRKNYFYPDMPKNYQISQYDLPFCRGGTMPVSGVGLSGGEMQSKGIGITRIHLEEDVAKSTHFGSYSGIDFNRAGIPLMEIVSEPDMRTPDEAYAYLTGLKQIMQYAEISDCDMEKGQLRCDVNVSVRPVDQTAFGEKIEIKNLNSFRAVHRALEYEIDRQISDLREGASLRQETRRWDDALGMTAVMRVKESAHDYRYFPEPDLMPLEIGTDWRNEIQDSLPERPGVRRDRFVAHYRITPYDADVLTQDKLLADYFERAVAKGATPKTVANWMQTELLRELSDSAQGIAESPVAPEALAELVALIEDKTISGKIAKDVFHIMFATGKAPSVIVEEKGLKQVSDDAEIGVFVDRALAENPAVVEDYRTGNKKSLQFLMGQVMKFSRGKANPQSANRLLKERLEASEG